MSWHRVGAESQAVAQGLVNKYSELLQKAGAPDGAEVYHCQGAAGDVTLYISPEASTLLANELREWPGVAPCSPPQNLANLTKVPHPRQS